MSPFFQAIPPCFLSFLSRIMGPMTSIWTLAKKATVSKHTHVRNRSKQTSHIRYSGRWSTSRPSPVRIPEVSTWKLDSTKKGPSKSPSISLQYVRSRALSTYMVMSLCWKTTTLISEKQKPSHLIPKYQIITRTPQVDFRVPRLFMSTEVACLSQVKRGGALNEEKEGWYKLINNYSI